MDSSIMDKKKKREIDPSIIEPKYHNGDYNSNALIREQTIHVCFS